jgi:hypothetical protein
VPVEGRAYVVVCRALLAREQSRRTHDHAWGAEAALERLSVDEGLLHGMQPAITGETFNGDDGLAVGDGRDARLHRAAIDEDGATAALSLAAPEFRSREQQLVPNHCQNAGLVAHVSGPAAAVHRQRHLWHRSSLRFSSVLLQGYRKRRAVQEER